MVADSIARLEDLGGMSRAEVERARRQLEKMSRFGSLYGVGPDRLMASIVPDMRKRLGVVANEAIELGSGLARAALAGQISGRRAYAILVDDPLGPADRVAEVDSTTGHLPHALDLGEGGQRDALPHGPGERAELDVVGAATDEASTAVGATHGLGSSGPDRTRSRDRHARTVRGRDHAVKWFPEIRHDSPDR